MVKNDNDRPSRWYHQFTAILGFQQFLPNTAMCSQTARVPGSDGLRRNAVCPPQPHSSKLHGLLKTVPENSRPCCARLSITRPPPFLSPTMIVTPSTPVLVPESCSAYRATQSLAAV